MGNQKEYEKRYKTKSKRFGCFRRQPWVSFDAAGGKSNIN